MSHFNRFPATKLRKYTDFLSEPRYARLPSVTADPLFCRATKHEAGLGVFDIGAEEKVKERVDLLYDGKTVRPHLGRELETVLAIMRDAHSSQEAGPHPVYERKTLGMR